MTVVRTIDPAAWVWTSRMYQLAMEINSPGMKAPGTNGKSILAAMFREGLIDTRVKNTRQNKAIVLQAMVDQMPENWGPRETVRRALDLGLQYIHIRGLGDPPSAQCGKAPDKDLPTTTLMSYVTCPECIALDNKED